uniref:Uncharacterized protein n=1 Tax=Sphaerodactylus townsendi TaxID=933632 RepID=A0ACB8G1H0_9SAUR
MAQRFLPVSNFHVSDVNTDLSRQHPAEGESDQVQMSTVSTLYDNRYNGEIKVLEDNKQLELDLQKISMPTEEINKLEIDGFTIWYKMVLPPRFDKSKKYPLLIQVYGGPCSQNVKHTFGITWMTYLASNEGVVVALVDGRGTAFQGDKMLYAVYRKLGVYEVGDQISAVRFADINHSP